MSNNRDCIPWERTAHSRKKTFSYAFNGDINLLSKHISDIYNNQKNTFKITMQFSFLLIKDVQVDGKKIKSIITFKLFYASTNTRLQGFENPVVIDNKKDIANAIETILKTSCD